MDLVAVIFYVFTVLTLSGAAIVVFSRNIVRAAFALMFTLFGVAGLYVLLMADFIAVTQLLVYVGGILVLVVFGVMLTQTQINVDITSRAMQTIPALVLTAALAGTLVGMAWSTDWNVLPVLPEITVTAAILGEMLLSTYVLPFEVASVILLAALIGAALIARREKNV